MTKEISCLSRSESVQQYTTQEPPSNCLSRSISRIVNLFLSIIKTIFYCFSSTPAPHQITKKTNSEKISIPLPSVPHSASSPSLLSAKVKKETSPHTATELAPQPISLPQDKQQTSPSPIGSVFTLTPEQLEFFTKRLHPQDNDQATWGCASLTGFLAIGEDLLSCCQKDRDTLLNRQLTHEAIANRIYNIIMTAKKEGVNKLVEGKFKVEIGEPTACVQFCPFTPGSDEKASPFESPDGTCGSANVDIRINNENNGRSIKFSYLLLHLIGTHHFFEGQVPYRLDPDELIDTLELKPGETCERITVAPQTPRLRMCSMMPINSKEILEFINSVAESYHVDVLEFENNVKGLILPTPNMLDLDESPPHTTKSGPSYLHIINTGDKAVKISGTALGIEFADMSIPASKWLSYRP